MTVRRRVRRADLVALAAILATVPTTGSAAQAAAPPPLEPIEVVRTIAAQPGARFDAATLLPDQEHILVQQTVGGSPQLGVIPRTGGAFRCITCEVASNASDPDPFDDGRRILVRRPEGAGAAIDAAGDLSPVGGGLGDLQFSIIECAPSIADCDRVSVGAVTFPIDGLTEGAQIREVAPTPDGEWLKFNEVRTTEGERMTIGRLVREGNDWVVVEPRVLNPPFELADDAAGWIDAGRFYESGGGPSGRSFSYDGRTLKYGATTTALNYDVWKLDLATGKRTRATTDVDYNEMSDTSPDGRWIAASSSRGLDRMDVFTEVVRPPFIDNVTFGQIGRIGLFNNRRCMNERWLWATDPGQQAGGYSGQPVVTEDGWLIRGWRWTLDGTGAVLFEERIPNEARPTEPSARSRIREIRFPARVPTRPPAAVALSEITDLSWAADYGTYHTISGMDVPRRVVRGPGGGTATLSFVGRFAAGRWEVRFDRYVDEHGRTITGTESLTTSNPLVQATWDAHLVVDRPGSPEAERLDGTITVGPQGRFTGTVRSTVDGRTRTGVPTQADCPGVRQAPLRITSVNVREGSGRRPARIVARVMADLPEDATPRPVRQVLVTGPEGRTARTDARGRVRMTLRGRGLPGVLSLRAQAGGFKPASMDAVRGADGRYEPVVTVVPRCLSRRRFAIRLPTVRRGERVVRWEVSVAGRRVPTLRRGTRRYAVVDLRGREAGRYRVVVRTRTSSGRHETRVRRFTTCAARRP
ncbi:hypothetical protein [Paraconexibacter sp.]|uniref:hypothetical protein n=1 Tax=Paraconexibacter sp. TaxID=2949640 RepID=UPI0035666075